MTTQKPEALRLADKYEVEGFLQDHRFAQNHWCMQAAVELRRLHAENEALQAQLEAIGAGGVEPLRKTNPLEIRVIKTHHGKLLRAALQEAEAALEIALARILKRDPGHSVNVTSEAKALVIVRNALDESSHPDHFRDAAKMVPAGWAISYDGKTPHALWTAGDGDLLDLEVKRQGGTACKMALYAAPQPPTAEDSSADHLRGATKMMQAAQQALEALEEATNYTSCTSWSPSMTDECKSAIAALREAMTAKG